MDVEGAGNESVTFIGEGMQIFLRVEWGVGKVAPSWRFADGQGFFTTTSFDLLQTQQNPQGGGGGGGAPTRNVLTTTRKF